MGPLLKPSNTGWKRMAEPSPGQPPAPVPKSTAPTILRVSFASPEGFLREYATKLMSTLPFVATPELLRLKDNVRLVIRLPPPQDSPDREVSLDAEVVRVVDSPGSRRGVGLQLRGSLVATAALRAAAERARESLRAGRPWRYVAATSPSLFRELQTAIPGAALERVQGSRIEELIEALRSDPPDILFLETANDGGATATAVILLRARPEFLRTSLIVVGPESARPRALSAMPEAFYAVPEEWAQLSRYAAPSFDEGPEPEFRVPISAMVRMHIDGVVVAGDCLDLSLGGASVAIAAKMNMGQRVDLDVVFKNGGPPASCGAEVVWVGEDRPARLWKLGLAFHGIAPAVRKRLREGIFEALTAATDSARSQIATPSDRVRRQEVRSTFRGEVRLYTGTAEVEAKGVDLSSGGIAMIARAPLDAGQHVVAVLMFPDKQPPLRCRAQVRWVRCDSAQNGSRIGLRFDGAPDPVVARLRAYAARPRPISPLHPIPGPLSG